MTPIFFTDRDLGKSVPTLLRAAGVSVEAFGDHFTPTATDVEWLPSVGRRGWYILTHDQRMQYRADEQTAILNAGLGVFILIGKVSHRALAENVIATMPVIERFLQHHPRPFIARVYRPTIPTIHPTYLPKPGRVALWRGGG